MSRLRRTVIPFTWQPLTLSFTQGTAASVNLSVFLSNPWGYPITFGTVGSLPSGVTLSGSTVSYSGLGAAASVSVRFTATSGQYQATVTTTVTITASTTVNTKPTWRTGTPTTLGSFVRSVGGSFNLSLWSFDAEADPIRYYRTGGIEDTAPSTVTVNELTGIVTIPVGVTIGNYGVGVVLSDGQSFSDPRAFTLTIANTAPVWSASTPTSLGTGFPQGSSSAVPLASYASDADGDTITFSRPGTAADTAPLTVTVNSTTGVVTIPAGLTATNYQLVVRLNDGKGGTADRTFTFSVEAPQTGGFTGTGTNATYTGGWRSTEDAVTGWDWTLPPTALPAARSGVFTWGNTTPPSPWPAHKIRIINAKWRDLEPTPGNYNFSSITGPLADTSWTGCFLNVRGFVVANPDYPTEVTCPIWLTGPTYVAGGITSLLMRDPNVKAKHLALIAAIGNAGILSNPRLWQQIIHLPGSTRGEEFNTTQGDPTADYAAAKEYITAWGNAAGVNKTKLMWTDDYGQVVDVLDHAMFTVGTGSRGGAIENWLWNQYSPGYSRYTGQTWDNGYLGVNENHPCISGRGWHDQNEAARAYDTPTNGLQQQHYRMAHLRAMQMRRKILWVRDGYGFNPQIDRWAAMDAGHTVTDANEAWCCLMRSWTRSRTDTLAYADREIKNLEKWLTQRDTTGATTTPVLQVNHGKNVSNNSALPTSLWYVNLARTGANIEFSLDSRFSNGPTPVAVKVTWFDSSTESWSLVYNKSTGGTGTRTATGGATNIAKTRTFFLSDFTGASALDLKLTSPGGVTPFMFVRVIKL